MYVYIYIYIYIYVYIYIYIYIYPAIFLAKLQANTDMHIASYSYLVTAVYSYLASLKETF